MWYARDVHPLSRVQRVLLPAIFAHGEKDEICPVHHADLLFENYAGDKTLFKFDGDHNSPRPDLLHDLISSFFAATLEGDIVSPPPPLLSNECRLPRQQGRRVSVSKSVGAG